MARLIGIVSAVLAAAICAAIAQMPDELPPCPQDGLVLPAEALTGGLAEEAAEADDELSLVLQTFTPAELQELVSQALKLLLQNERRMVAAEMSNPFYAPSEVRNAISEMNKQPPDTISDNVARICRAFAAVDSRFGKAYGLFEEGKYAEAADAASRIVNPKQCTFLGAARYYIYGQALAQCGKHEEAVDAYSQIWERMRDRTSFAALASLKTAQTWEQVGRGLYAMRMYSLYRDRYQLILDDAGRAELDRKVEELQAVYRDPLGTVAGRMGNVRQRLADSDSGGETRKQQESIVALLDDLIRSAEEGSSGSSSSSGQSGSKGHQKQGSSQQPGAAVAGTPPTGSPASPAQESVLRDGPNVRPTGTSEVRNTAESGDWATLPPREKQKLEELKRKVMSERYQDIISDYHRRLAKQLSE